MNPTPNSNQLDQIGNIVAQTSDNPGFGIGIGFPLGMFIVFTLYRILNPILNIFPSPDIPTEKDDLSDEIEKKIKELDLIIAYRSRIKKYDTLISNETAADLVDTRSPLDEDWQPLPEDIVAITNGGDVDDMLEKLWKGEI